jgi:hypothetical protein
MMTLWKTTNKKQEFLRKQLYNLINNRVIALGFILMSGGGSDDPAVLVMRYLTLDEFV